MRINMYLTYILLETCHTIPYQPVLSPYLGQSGRRQSGTQCLHSQSQHWPCVYPRPSGSPAHTRCHSAGYAVKKMHRKTQYNTIQYNTIQYNIIQYNTIQYNTTQYNTIQYNTIQYNTIQYNTIQYNTIPVSYTHLTLPTIYSV